ncbi:hypothetical protein BLOT_003427 [Blomia tropicalis]|nr:hypothetical protein BLOT_003427 [Blomia tropicalis]
MFSEFFTYFNYRILNYDYCQPPQYMFLYLSLLLSDLCSLIFNHSSTPTSILSIKSRIKHLQLFMRIINYHLLASSSLVGESNYEFTGKRLTQPY